MSFDPIGDDLRDEISYWLAGTTMTQADLAEAVGCSQPHVSRMLSGQRTLPTDLAARMLRAVGRVGVVSSVSITEDEQLTDAVLGQIPDGRTYAEERLNHA